MPWQGKLFVPNYDKITYHFLLTVPLDTAMLFTDSLLQFGQMTSLLPLRGWKLTVGQR